MLYSTLRKFLWLVWRIFFRVRITGAENLPKTGAYLLSGNHISSYDPISLAICTKRQLHFMGKKELFENRIYGGCLRAVGAFPVDRGNIDMKAYRHAMDILNQGRPLAIFSQGTRMRDYSNVKNGAAMFSLKTGAPIVPVGINSSYRIFSSLTINIGTPISMEPYKDMKIKSELVEEVMSKVVEQVSALSKQ